MNTTSTTSSSSHALASDMTNVVLSTLSGSLSIIGTSFIIITYFVWKDIQTTSRRILVYISIADFFSAVGNIVGVLSPRNETVCLVQSIIGTFFALSSFFWTVFLAVYLFVGCTRKKLIVAEHLMVVFHVIGWGVPFITVCIAATSGKLGYNGDMVSSGWCWITGDMSWKEQVKWMLIAGKFWEVFAFIVITILYIVIRRGMRKELNNAENLQLSGRSSKAVHTAERKLIIIPLSFVALRIWGTIRFFIFIRHGGSGIYWLIIMQGIGDSLQGFLNFLIFCFFTDKVLSQIRMVISGCCYKLCPGMLVTLNKQPNQYDKLHCGVCDPTSSISPDYRTFGKSDDELGDSGTINP